MYVTTIFCLCLISCVSKLFPFLGVYYELSEIKVCQFYAELLLRPAGKVSESEALKIIMSSQ